MLAARHVAREIGVSAIGRRHGGVVLLDAALHLLEQRLLQRLRIRPSRARCVGVLRFEIGADVGPERGRIAHHLLPIRGAQPSVIVHALDAVVKVAWRAGFRPRAE